ncbi:MAG: class I SAM-dependent methyltransferase [Verrucomicrobia subdivision 3 bacterium]|nr:class I SAM-dependent methyltransferase [Limisphaerales bacterium]
MLAALKKHFARDWDRGAARSNDWAGEIVATLRPDALLDVGCGDGSKLYAYLNYKPKLFCGIEGSPSHAAQAEARGIKVTSIDLNGRWPYPDNQFDVVHCAYLIEHLHNTRLFAMETFRVLKPGGTAVITSENLASLLNLGAMALGYTPFTLANCCGWILGNPLGLHYQEEFPDYVKIDDPAFSGVTGHVRALTVPQAKELFDKVGFRTEAASIGLLPLPNSLGQLLERICYRRGHFLLIRATKPTQAA